MYGVCWIYEYSHVRMCVRPLGVRMLDGDINDFVEARSLGHNVEHVDIMSASWGPDDNGTEVDGPGELARKAFLEGTSRGAHCSLLTLFDSIRLDTIRFDLRFTLCKPVTCAQDVTGAASSTCGRPATAAGRSTRARATATRQASTRSASAPSPPCAARASSRTVGVLLQLHCWCIDAAQAVVPGGVSVDAGHELLVWRGPRAAGAEDLDDRPAQVVHARAHGHVGERAHRRRSHRAHAAGQVRCAAELCCRAHLQSSQQCSCLLLARACSPRLGWRDVQYVTLIGASPELMLADGHWVTNALGRNGTRLNPPRLASLWPVH